MALNETIQIICNNEGFSFLIYWWYAFKNFVYYFSMKNIQILNTLTDLQKVNLEFPLSYAICFFQVGNNEGIKFVDLAKLTSMKLPTISRIVQKLSDNHFGLLHVRADPKSRRSKMIFLTAKGKAIYMKSIQAK